jgi:hypothetical protein
MRIALMAVVLAALMVYGQQSKPQSATHTQSPAEAVQEPSSAAAPSVVVKNQNTSQRQEEKHPAEPLSYLHELLLPQNLPALALVAVGIAGIWVAVCTLKDIQKQTENAGLAARAAQASANALVNAERPWIVVTPTPSSDGWSCTFDARNFGRTPAEIISSDAKFAIVDDGEDVPILPKEGKFHLAHRILMLPEAVDPIEKKRSPHNVYVLHRNAVLQGQTEERRKMIAVGQKRLMVYGIVVYEDVLTKGGHYTRFCYCCSPSGGDVIPAGSDGANEHT